MKTLLPFLLLFLLPQLLPGQLEQEITAYLNTIKESNDIPGVAVAVLRGDEVLYEGYFGEANLTFQVPVTEETLFRVYSSTKLMTAVAIFQLVDDGKIKVTDPIGKHLDDLPAAWNDRSVADLLAHASGLTDLLDFGTNVTTEKMLSMLAQEPILFAPGALYHYNQTNYWLLARVIEKYTGKTFDEAVIDGQFGGNTQGLCFSSNGLEVIPNRTGAYRSLSNGGWASSGDNIEDYAHAANGLAINLPTLIAWAQRLNRQELLSPAANAEMTQEYQFSNPHDHFLHGWGMYPVNGQASRGFTGGLVSGIRFFPKQDITILYLSNGFRYVPSHNRVINRIAGMVDKELYDPALVAQEEAIIMLLQANTEKALSTFISWRKLHESVPLEGELNSVGYALLGDNRVEDAIKIFWQNTKEYPAAWNVWDSLGEGYEMAGDNKQALKYYRRSVELNPENQHGIDKIKQLSK